MRRANLRSWISIAVLALLVAGCGGGGKLALSSLDNTGPGSELVQEFEKAAPRLQFNPGTLALPLPSVLHAASAASASEKTGEKYELAWPSSNVTAGSSSATFAPHWAVQDSIESSGYALYRMTVPEPAQYYSLSLQWKTVNENFDNLWIGVANFQKDRWDWFRSQSSSVTPFVSAGHQQAGEVYIAIVCLGFEPRELQLLSLAKAEFGIQGVTPSSGASGALTYFSAIVVGGNPSVDKYSWDFGSSAMYEMVDSQPLPLVNGVSKEVSPRILLEDVGSYSCTLTVKLAAGIPLDPYQFQLQVTDTGIPPEIIALYPRFTPAGSGNAQLFAGSLVTQTAHAIVTGTRPVNYAWNFAGGATPDNFDWDPIHVSVEITPIDTWPADRTVYANALMNAENAYGNDGLPFDFIVEQPPTFFGGNGISYWGLPGAQMQFTLGLRSGTLPLTFSWDLGGGGVPDTYDQTFHSGQEPPTTVILGPAAKYAGQVAVSNNYTDPANPPNASFDLYVGVPHIESVVPDSGNENTEYTFDASILGDDEAPGLQPLTYAWNFGGGATPNTSTEANPVVTLGANGSYDCSLQFSNKFGTDILDFTLTVQDSPTVNLAASPMNISVGESVDFDASDSSDTDGVIVNYQWDWDGDGIFDADTGSSAQTSHIYDQLGQFMATVKVTDDDGAMSSDSATVKVSGVPGFVITTIEVSVEDAAGGSGSGGDNSFLAGDQISIVAGSTTTISVSGIYGTYGGVFFTPGDSGGAVPQVEYEAALAEVQSLSSWVALAAGAAGMFLSDPVLSPEGSPVPHAATVCGDDDPESDQGNPEGRLEITTLESGAFIPATIETNLIIDVLVDPSAPTIGDLVSDKGTSDGDCVLLSSVNTLVTITFDFGAGGAPGNFGSDTIPCELYDFGTQQGPGSTAYVCSYDSSGPLEPRQYRISELGGGIYQLQALVDSTTIVPGHYYFVRFHSASYCSANKPGWRLVGE